VQRLGRARAALVELGPQNRSSMPLVAAFDDDPRDDPFADSLEDSR
jgi:hypothetical protein